MSVMNWVNSFRFLLGHWVDSMEQAFNFSRERFMRLEMLRQVVSLDHGLLLEIYDALEPTAPGFTWIRHFIVVILVFIYEM